MALPFKREFQAGRSRIERIARTDPGTGVEVLQLTSFPLMHYHQYCYGQWIAHDAQTLLLFAYRQMQRDAPVDLWRVNSDGSDLAPVAKNASWAVISADGQTVYAGREGSIVRVPLFGGPEEEFVRLPDATSVLVCAASLDGRFIFAHARLKDDMAEVVRVDLKDARAESICRTAHLMHLQLHAGNRLLANIQPPGEQIGIWDFSFDGDDFRRLPFARSSNHFASLGTTGGVITSVVSPGNALEVAAPGDREATVLAEGVGFWHPTSDASGEWVVSDTNWPDVGLQLVHVPSGRFRTLCSTGASGGHPQWTHAHPRLAPNAEYVVFDSDRTGIAQVYLARIPEAFKASLRGG